MNHLSIAWKPVGSLTLLCLLVACGPLALGPYWTSAVPATSSSGSASGWRDLFGGSQKLADAQPWTEAGEHIRSLADEVASLAPDVIGLHDAATWRRADVVLHDDVALLLDELWLRDLAYRVASEAVVIEDRVAEATDAGAEVRLEVRHLVLVREGTGVTVGEASHGRYESGSDGWAAAALLTPDGPITVVATGLASGRAGAEVDELVDLLALAQGKTLLGTGLDIGDPAVAVLGDAGYVPTEERGDSLLLERDAAASEGR